MAGWLLNAGRVSVVVVVNTALARWSASLCLGGGGCVSLSLDDGGGGRWSGRHC